MQAWREGGGGRAYRANGLLVSDGVDGGRLLVAALKLVADKGGAERLDHELVVVEGLDDIGGGDVADGSGDLGGRHFEG